MTNEIIDLDVGKNSRTGQKYLNLPKDSAFQEEGKARVIWLGQNWEHIPGTLRTYNNLQKILTLLVRADNDLDETKYTQAKEAMDKVREAGELVGEAMDLLDEEFSLVVDPEEYQD